MAVYYISGPMTGIEDFNRPMFDLTAERLRNLGHIVFNPSETFGRDTTLDKWRYMEIDLAAVRACDAVVLLPGWDRSEGALQEVQEAKRHGKDILMLHEVQQCNG